MPLDAITKKQIRNCVIQYLKLRIPDFVQSSKNGLFTCPECLQTSAHIYPVNSGNIHCFTPECGNHGNIFDLCRKYDFNGQNISDEDIADLLIDEFAIKTNKQIQCWLEKYQKWGWSLVPCEKNSKKANIESGWEMKSHKDINEWKEWLSAGLNVGRHEGQISNSTTIDIDTNNIPEELKKFIGETLTQVTKNGTHLTYIFEPELPSKNLRFQPCQLPIEIRNSQGWQTVIFPSIVEGKERFFNDKDPITMPEELKKWLLDKIVTKDAPIVEKIENVKISENDFTFEKLNGSRNNTFLQFGGILRKYYSIKDVERIMTLVNNGFIDKALPQKEIKAMVKELGKYGSADANNLSKQISDYLTRHEEASSRDLVECLKMERRDIQESLAQLIQDNKVYKQRSMYKIIQTPDWKTAFMSESKVLGFNIPYFQDYATFRRGDMICLGAATGVGKGHISMNIVKKYVVQDIKPHYVSSEPGNRFSTIAMNLGLKEGDFKFINHYHPEQLELEDEAITIYDWILPEDFAGTANLYKIFAKQLDRHGGLLYVLSQLNDNGDFYASSMVRFFSSFAVKYFYTKINGITDNINTFFRTSKIRESKSGTQEITIPTKYNPDTKQLELRKP